MGALVYQQAAAQLPLEQLAARICIVSRGHPGVGKAVLVLIGLFSVESRVRTPNDLSQGFLGTSVLRLIQDPSLITEYDSRTHEALAPGVYHNMGATVRLPQASFSFLVAGKFDSNLDVVSQSPQA